MRFFASGGMGLLARGPGFTHRLPSTHQVDPQLRHRPLCAVRDQEGFANQLRLPRKTLEMERRILVLLRNSGCNAVPHPNDFVYDANPALAGPYATEDNKEWTYDDKEMLQAEPYLVMEMVAGRSLEEVLAEAPNHRLSPARTLRMYLPGGRGTADACTNPGRCGRA